jgi:predicted tellurium resistance membrane protein TerC
MLELTFTTLLLAADAPAAGAGLQPGGVAPLLSMASLIALISLAALEIVLGIDNIVFLSILTGKLPPERRAFARRLGLGLALGARIVLLLSITWIMGLTKPWFSIQTFGLIEGVDAHAVTGKDLILLLGGLFLMFKAVKEIHHKVDGHESAAGTTPDPVRGLAQVSFRGVIGQIILVDLVFSLDSVITAVGMAQRIEIMVAAVIIAMIVMLALAAPIARFVEKHPTVKMLALAFLLLIGFTLVLHAFHAEIPKGYVYFAMAFSLGVEFLNLWAAKRHARRHARLNPGGTAPDHH